MKTSLSAIALLAIATPLAAQEAPTAPSPNEIVAQAPASDWVAIAPDDLLVMTLAPAADGTERQVIIQLMPAPFSEAWTANIRTLARAHWYDGITINRVQDNYVVQWGDPNVDNPEADGEAKPLPDGLVETSEADYVLASLLDIPDPRGRPRINYHLGATMMRNAMIASGSRFPVPADPNAENAFSKAIADFKPVIRDNYATLASLIKGWPIAGDTDDSEGPSEGFWPVHCYGMVGVGRSYSPDAGTGAELYTVIGHAPRHLDRNIALVGRVIEGMEHLSSLPRGSGALGFYTDDELDKRTPIQSIRVVADLPADRQPHFEYLSTESETFAQYAEARANRRDPFFIVAAGGADICNIPVPIRRAD